MAAQFDFNAGFDPSALSSITAAQFLQMIQQIAPLGNIGGIVWQAGTSLSATIAQGTGGSPSVTDNPRFARYQWNNTYDAAASAPTPYLYNAATGNWVLQTIAAGSIFNASLATNAEIEVSKLADGSANQVIRTDAAGTGVEWVTLSTLLAALNDSVPLTAIDDTAAVGAENFLRRVGSTVVWKTFTETVTAIQAALNGVPPTTLTPGANNTVLGTNSAGVVAFDTIDNIIANLAIGLAKISIGGASANDILRCDGTNWVKVTPSLRITASDVANTGILSGAALNTNGHTIPHLLTTNPKLIRVVAVLTSADATSTASQTYSVGDEVDLAAFNVAASDFRAFSISSDAYNVYLGSRITGALALSVPSKLGTVGIGAIDETLWTPKVYAWK